MYLKRECNSSFSHFIMAHIVTWSFICMTGICAMLDQCSFILYLSSNNGQDPMTSLLKESGKLCSGNELFTIMQSK